MPQPVNTPRWNTTGANRTDPPSGQKDSGFVLSAPLVSAYLNWLLFTIYEWVLYLKDLTNETLTWLQTHTFNKGIVVLNSIVNGHAVNATGNGTGAGVRGVPATGGGVGFGGVNGDADGVSGGIAGLFTAQHATGGIALKARAAGSGGIGSKAIDAQITGGDGVVAVLTDGGTGGALVATSSSNAAPVASIAGFGTQQALDIQGVGTGKGIVANASQNYSMDLDQGSSSAVDTMRSLARANGQSAGYFEGATSARGATVSGPGARFQGGSPAVGTGSPGLSATGGSAAAGAVLQGGTGISNGANITGGNVGGAALRVNSGVNNTQPVIDCRGTIDFANAASPAITVGLANKLTRDLANKAWVLFTVNGTVNPTVIAGQNVASVTQVIGGGTGGLITVNLATGWAVSGQFGATFQDMTVAGGQPPVMEVITRGAAAMDFYVESTAGVIRTGATTGKTYLVVFWGF